VTFEDLDVDNLMTIAHAAIGLHRGHNCSIDHTGTTVNPMHLLPPHPSPAFTLPRTSFPASCLAIPFTLKVAVIPFAGDTPFEMVDIGQMPAGGENSGDPRAFSSPQSMGLLLVASV